MTTQTAQTSENHPVAPHPGSARAKLAEFEAMAAAIPEPAPAPPPGMVTVPVREQGGEDGTARTITLDDANPYALALPQDPGRYRALIIASATSVYLCASKELAQEVGVNASKSAGGSLPANVVVEIRSKGLWYVANQAPATAETVTIIVERYQNPEA